MASAVQKVTLTSSRDIPFSKLRLSESNVRRTVAGVSIENLAEDIARRTLLQSLSVRPVLDAESKETGIFEVQAGGRRYRALELLVKQKRMSKTQLVPCIVQTSGLAEEDSLAENVHRENLHPLDQFRAFQTLREKGLSEEDIAARFFVSTTVVKQRLKLAAVSPKLLDVYSADQMSLEQLMAFTVTNDHAHQEAIWDQVSHTRGFTDEPYNIRRKLTEGAVRATDRRAVFVGVDAYEVAGGAVTRDLFEPDGGGWLQDPALLDRLVIEKLKAEAEKVQAEGWKWIAVATDFSYGHTAGLRSLHGRIVELTEEETAAHQALEAEFDRLEQQYAEAEDVPEEIDRRISDIETELAAFNDRPVIYEPTELALAGAFVSIDRDGTLRIDRGYVRPEDEPRTEPAEAKEQEGAEAHRLPAGTSGGSQHGVITVGAAGASPPETEAEEEDGIRPLSERLISELTAFRTLALRDAVANNPHVAMTALLHKLCIDVFHQHAFENCLEATVHEVSCPIQPADLDESVPAKAVKARHKAWLAELPRTDTALWEWLDALSSTRRQELLAHCVSFGVNAFYDKDDRSGPWGVKRRIAHADRLARAVGLDPVRAGWSPTVDNYLGRVPKARILEAVREAKGDASAQLIDHLKKPDMAKEAERLLAKTGWLPEPLRTLDAEAEEAECESDAEDLPAFLDEEDDEDPVKSLPNSIAGGRPDVRPPDVSHRKSPAATPGFFLSGNAMPCKRWDRNPKQSSKHGARCSMNDHEAMLAIQQELDGVEWRPDTLERVAEVLQQAGYRIRDLDDHDPGDEAIHPGRRDPKGPVRAPGPDHVLAILREGHVRHQITTMLETDRDFGDVTPNAVSDEEIHDACLSVAATIDLSEEVGLAAFKAALTALGAAGRRHG